MSEMIFFVCMSQCAKIFENSAIINSPDFLDFFKYFQTSDWLTNLIIELTFQCMFSRKKFESTGLNMNCTILIFLEHYIYVYLIDNFVETYVYFLSIKVINNMFASLQLYFWNMTKDFLVSVKILYFMITKIPQGFQGIQHLDLIWYLLILHFYPMNV